MKRWFGLIIPASLGLAVAAVLSGCPIYDGDSGHRVCPPGQTCYDCPNSYYTNECVPWRCNSGYDCPGGYVCDNNLCRSTGPQDCRVTGCPSGQDCKLSSGKLQCVPGTPQDGGSPDSGTPTVCNVEGTRDACAADSVCLNKKCYVSCSLDAGPDLCKNRVNDRYNTCKNVSASSGTYPICVSEVNEGSECDLAAGRDCTRPNVCIDGFCK